MKKKKWSGLLTTALIVFSPLLFTCAKTYAADKATTKNNGTEYSKASKSGEKSDSGKATQSADGDETAKSKAKASSSSSKSETDKTNKETSPTKLNDSSKKPENGSKTVSKGAVVALNLAGSATAWTLIKKRR